LERGFGVNAGLRFEFAQQRRQNGLQIGGGSDAQRLMRRLRAGTMRQQTRGKDAHQ